MGFFEFVQNQFMHVLPIILSAAFAIAIIIERVMTLFFTYPLHNTKAFFDKIRELLLSGRTADAVSFCDQYPSQLVPKIVKSALLRAHLPENLIEHGIELEVGEQTQKIQKRTSFLATIANVATLLGLFGTILGLIHSFQAVGSADPQQKSALLAQGISTSMNATMAGLGVAIPCMVAFAFLMNKSTRLSGEIEHSGVRTLDLLKQRYYMGEEEWDQASTQKSNGKATSTRAAA